MDLDVDVENGESKKQLSLVFSRFSICAQPPDVPASLLSAF